MKRALIIFCLFVMTTSALWAQEIVTGKVVDGKNEPFPGVRVEVVDRSEYVITDIDGNFRIELPEPAKNLRFSYVGYKPIEKRITPYMTVKLGSGWSGKASGYRGFFDFVGGFGTGGEINIYGSDDTQVTEIGRSSIAFGWFMTHGYQINHRFFAGLGFGLNWIMLYKNEREWGEDYSGHSFCGGTIPLYADFRWDYDILAKTAPFVDLKLGYQFIVGANDDDYHYYYGDNLYVDNKNTKGIFLMPTIGMRTSIGSKRGINIGLSYNIFVKRRFNVSQTTEICLPGEEVITDVVEKSISATGGIVMLNFGFDF